ncbi:Ninjurin-2 [Halotydeus destructor]|nr:Ninjurin-2 [Halotydeus destructor]
MAKAESVDAGTSFELVPSRTGPNVATFRSVEMNTDAKQGLTMDANVYATKKTIAQGMLDVALLTANASQLKYLLQLGPKDQPFYHVMLSLISLSIFLQIMIGIVITVKSRYSINEEGDQKRAHLLNDIVVYLVFAMTVVNVFLGAFGIDPGMAHEKMILELEMIKKAQLEKAGLTE